MSSRTVLSVIAVFCIGASIVLIVTGQLTNGALILLAVGVITGIWAWLRSPSATPVDTPLVEPPVEQQRPTVTPLPPPPLQPQAPPIPEEEVEEKPKVPKTMKAERLVADHLGLSAEEMAIQKPLTPQITSNLDEDSLGEAVRKAGEKHAEKEKERERDRERDDAPTRPDRRMLGIDAPDETHPTRPERIEKPIVAEAGLSAEEMAMQKPTTPSATETFDDSELDQALSKAKARAQTRKTEKMLTADEMAKEKPETTETTRKISRDMLPPTSTNEMASKKPVSDVSTSEIEGTIEAKILGVSGADEAVQVAPAVATETPAEPATPDEVNVAEEKPVTPLSTIEQAVEPGALPIDTPLIDVPPPSTQMMEVEASPNDSDRHPSTQDTLEVTTAEVAAEGPLNKDDLTKIEGIGPKIAALLIAAGISTFSRLATTPEEELREILHKADFKQPTPTLPTWWEQAVIAARGDWDALKDYQDKLGKKSSED